MRVRSAKIFFRPVSRHGPGAVSIGGLLFDGAGLGGGFWRFGWRPPSGRRCAFRRSSPDSAFFFPAIGNRMQNRSEEHTSELQSHLNLVCRLLLEKKKHIA